MRYIGQSFELTVSIPGDALSSAALENADADFHRAHQQSYGFNAPQEPTEIVSLNLRAVGYIGKPKPVVPRTPDAPAPAGNGRSGFRSAAALSPAKS